ncbi:MAG: hypothetical protein ACRDEA_16090, partial [Microcystaceae cyanobacterium]
TPPDLQPDFDLTFEDISNLVPTLGTLATNPEMLDTQNLPENANDSLLDEPLTKNTDWFTLARKLRQQNRDLIKTVVQLEQALAESQQQLQSQVKRSHSTDELIVQQEEALNKTQAQITHLSNQLEVSQENNQRQQLTLENLATQLDTSQEQVAQLERQLVLLQEDDNDKAQKLISSEKQIRELQSRLQRQQRYTLQYKAALEHYSEVSAAQESVNQSSDSPISKVTSIQPWSSQAYSPVLNTQLEPESSLTEDPSVKSPSAARVEIEQPLTLEIDACAKLETANPNGETINSELEKIATNTNSTLDRSASVPVQAVMTDAQPSWSAPIISPASKRQSSPTIDLPAFLRREP